MLRTLVAVTLVLAAAAAGAQKPPPRKKPVSMQSTTNTPPPAAAAPAPAPAPTGPAARPGTGPLQPTIPPLTATMNPPTPTMNAPTPTMNPPTPTMFPGGIPTRPTPVQDARRGPGYRRGAYWGMGRYVPPGAWPAVAEEPVPGTESEAPPNIVYGGNDADLSLSAPQLVNLLADPSYSVEGKRRTEVELVQGGMSSVPTLIERLGDGRVFDEVETSGPDGTAKRERITVGQECETLLYHIITPPYRSPHEKRLEKPGSTTMFTVKDWRSWWGHNRARKLVDVHTEVKGAVDRYWQQGGVEQTLQ